MVALFSSGAPNYSDAVLIFEIGVAIALLAGMFVVRSGHVRLHRAIQGSMVLVNIPVVLLWMVPQYLTFVLPNLGNQFGSPVYLYPTLMLIAGGIAEGLGIYIVLVAATSWIPERFRFRRYKLWMRTELVLWWLVLLAGITTYYAWYPPA